MEPFNRLRTEKQATFILQVGIKALTAGPDRASRLMCKDTAFGRGLVGLCSSIVFRFTAFGLLTTAGVLALDGGELGANEMARQDISGRSC